MKSSKIALITGFALFAMFFGAGNIVFPLRLGAIAGDNIFYVIAAFIAAGVMVPYLGLYTLSLYKGDYWAFFHKLGKLPALAIVTFVLLIIGPLFAGPRTAVVTFHTFAPFLPNFLCHPAVFNAFYFSVILFLIIRPNQVIDVIGRFISPVKFTFFLVLIILACVGVKQYHASTLLPAESIVQSLNLGYGTMDLLGAFFYCSVAYHYIQLKCKSSNISDPKKIQRVMTISCLVAAITTTLIYIGLMLASYFHAQQLHGVSTESLIPVFSTLVLGKFGAFFVCIFIFIASIATATALAEVSAAFFTRYIFLGKLSRNQCLIMVLVTMYAMSILGFSMIMRLAIPILSILYPLLIVYTAYNLLDKKFGLHERLFARKAKARLISVEQE